MAGRSGRPRGRAPKPEVLDREQAVVSLRREGLTWEEIAKRVGYSSPSSAHDAYQRAANRIIREDVDAIRNLESERLDCMHAAVWERALEGDLKAVDAVLKIMARRAKLFGLDIPPSAHLHQQHRYDYIDPDLQERVNYFVRIIQEHEESEVEKVSRDAVETLLASAM